MFTLEYAKDPFWNDPEGKSIHLTLKWEEFNEELPFNATSYDTEPYGVDLFNRAKAGEFGEVLPFDRHTPTAINFDPTPTQE